MTRARALAATAAVALLAAAPPARAQYFAGSFLLDGSFGIGVEPHGRAPVQCSRTVGSGASMETTSNPQCNMVLAFGVGAEALWRGLVGVGIGLYAAEGAPVIVTATDSQGRPIAFGDRISTVLSLAVRPLAPLAWRFGADRWPARLAAGLGLQFGPAVEYSRISLQDATHVGFHFAAALDVPLSGANTKGGVALHLGLRVIVSPDAEFIGSNFHVLEPGTAAQLMVGVAYYL